MRLMEIRTLWILTCSPLALMLAAWGVAFWRWHERRPKSIALIALLLATANAAYAAGIAACYRFQASPLAPWKDPQTLSLASLFALAAAVMIVGFVALAEEAPKWLVVLVELSSLPLLVIGLYVGSLV